MCNFLPQGETPNEKERKSLREITCLQELKLDQLKKFDKITSVEKV